MKYLYSLIFLILLLTNAGQSAAQTYRIAAGVSPKGVKTYIEVYEYDYVSEKPDFPGGDPELTNYINSARRYPAEAYKKDIQGRVTCSFIVNVDGSVSHISVLKGVEPSLNDEAVRIISTMPDWHPGKQDGTTVPVRVVCSIPFRK